MVNWMLTKPLSWFRVCYPKNRSTWIFSFGQRLIQLCFSMFWLGLMPYLKNGFSVVISNNSHCLHSNDWPEYFRSRDPFRVSIRKNRIGIDGRVKHSLTYNRIQFVHPFVWASIAVTRLFIKQIVVWRTVQPPDHLQPRKAPQRPESRLNACFRFFTFCCLLSSSSITVTTSLLNLVVVLEPLSKAAHKSSAL